MSIFRRFKLYFFGVALGLILTYHFFNDRYPTWLPGSVITEELQRNRLTYSKHALCRMACRNISKEEIGAVLKSGSVNFKKSKVHETPCPSYALEGRSKDGQNLRIIFAKCDSVTTVITAIDLDRKYNCKCN